MFLDSEREITSIGDYISTIQDLQIRDQENPNKVYFQWYRGHANKEWELIPKVQRDFTGTDEELFRKERALTNDFQSRAALFQSTKLPINDFPNWLTLMQHYGLPTRLLDWSRSPLVALYFALSDQSMWQRDACIWILTPGRLNEAEELEKPTVIDNREYKNAYIYNMAHKTISTMIYTAFKRWKLSRNKDLVTPDDRKFDHRMRALAGKIAACYPIEADSRVYNQFAAFTVHNTAKKLVDTCDTSALRRLTIPAQAKESLLEELSICGITQSYIFPDLEHLANEISRW